MCDLVSFYVLTELRRLEALRNDDRYAAEELYELNLYNS